jgi:O-antigen/teichoic acid export membrane protein
MAIGGTVLRRPAAGVQAAAGRLGWGVADQGISSLSNFFVGAYVAKTMGAESLGVFALVLLTYAVVLNGSRGLSTDPLLVRFSGAEPPAWRRAVRSSSGTALVVGVLSGALSATAGAVVLAAGIDDLGWALLALGAGLPGLMLQDSWRYAFYADGRGRKSFLNDLVWTVLMVGGVLLVGSLTQPDVTTVFLVFGGSATVAAGYGIVQSGVLPRPGWAITWVREHRDLASRYLVENLALSLSGQFRTVILSVVAGFAAAGQLRVVEMLFGPFLIVLRGLAQVAVPEAHRHLVKGVDPFYRFCRSLSLGVTTLALLYGLGLIVVMPMGIGDLLFGDLWRDAYPLLPAGIVISMSASFMIGASSGLRTLGQARLSLRAQLFSLVLGLTGSTLGALSAGVAGTVWGSAAAGVLSAAFWWQSLRLALREGVAPPDPDGPEAMSMEGVL